MRNRIGRCLLWVGLLATCPLGCKDRAATEPPVAPSTAPPSPIGAGSPSDRPTFDETKGYFHERSGVGFVYPEGWENLGETSRGPFTSLALRRHEPRIDVTLYWSIPDGAIDAANVGEVEYAGLRPLYGEKVGKPVSVRAGGQPGFRLAISGGPLGQANADLSGVIYVFAVGRGDQSWKVKLRATAGSREHLSLAEELLRNYRW